MCLQIFLLLLYQSFLFSLSICFCNNKEKDIPKNSAGSDIIVIPIIGLDMLFLSWNNSFLSKYFTAFSVKIVKYL